MFGKITVLPENAEVLFGIEATFASRTTINADLHLQVREDYISVTQTIIFSDQDSDARLGVRACCSCASIKYWFVIKLKK